MIAAKGPHGAPFSFVLGLEPLGWIASLLLALPWLFAMQGRLWTASWREAAMAAALLALAAATCGRSRIDSLPRPALFVALLSLLPLLQWAAGLIVFRGDAWLASGYLVAFALAIVVGGHRPGAETLDTGKVVLRSLLIAALVSALLMLAQAAGLDQATGWIASPPDVARPAAHVGQPNNAATLLVCGLASLLGLAVPGNRANRLAAIAAAACLLAALAMTQSRAGLLGLLVIGVAGITRSQAFLCSRRRAALLLTAALAWWAACWVAWLVLIPHLFATTADVASRLTGGVRTVHWHTMWEAIAHKPWWGWGWQQVAAAQAGHAASQPASGEPLQYAHNLFLDLAVWNGLPVAVLTAGLAGLWVVRTYRTALSNVPVSLLLCVLAMAVHAMFELPHGYLLFLVPLGLAVGALSRPFVIGMKAGVLAWALALVLGTGLFITARDYLLLEQAWQDHRFQVAAIAGYQTLEPVPDVIVLDQLRGLVAAARIQPGVATPAEELQLLRTVAERYPSWGNVLRYALSRMAVGDQRGAEQALLWMRQTQPVEVCESAMKIWRRKTDELALGSAYAFPVCERDRLR